jgi:hypothetical protein
VLHLSFIQVSEFSCDITMNNRRPLLNKRELKLIGNIDKARNYVVSHLNDQCNMPKFLTFVSHLLNYRVSKPQNQFNYPVSYPPTYSNYPIPHAQTSYNYVAPPPQIPHDFRFSSHYEIPHEPSSYNNRLPPPHTTRNFVPNHSVHVPQHRNFSNPYSLQHSPNHPQFTNKKHNQKRTAFNKRTEKSVSPLPNECAVAFTKFFNNEYSIALMKKDIEDLSKGVSKYARAISKVLPKPQVHPIMSSSTKAIFDETQNMVQQLTRKQLDLNLSLYMDYKVILWKDIVQLQCDKTMLTTDILAAFLIPRLATNLKSRRGYNVLKKDFFVTMKSSLSDWLSIGQMAEMEVSTPIEAIATVSRSLTEQVIAPSMEMEVNQAPRKRKNSGSSVSLDGDDVTPKASRNVSPSYTPVPSIIHQETVSTTPVVARHGMNTAPQSRVSSPTFQRPVEPHIRYRFRPIPDGSSRTTPPSIPAVTNPTPVASMKIAASSNVIVELSTISLAGDSSVFPVPPPENTFTHHIKKSFTKDDFITLSNNSLSTYNDPKPVIIQFVLTNDSLPPLSHFSLKVDVSFLYNNLPWLLSLTKPFVIELYADSKSILDTLQWSKFINWANSHNVSLFITTPKSLSHNLLPFLINNYSKSAVLLDRPFR